MFVGHILTAPKGWLLRPSDLHTVDADRDVVVGWVLDQQEVGASSRRTRRHDRVDDDDTADVIGQ